MHVLRTNTVIKPRRRIMYVTYICKTVLLLCSTPPLMIIERSPNRPTGYAGNLLLHVSSKRITLAGSVHRSRPVMGVYSSVHVMRCVVSCSCMLQRVESGVVWFGASTLCTYDVRKGDLFVLGCDVVL